MRDKPKWLVLLLTMGLCVYMGAQSMAPAASPTTLAGSASTLLPVIVYQQILREPALQGERVLSPEQLAGDLAYLRERGYSTITASQAAAYARGEGDLPDRPILLCFDGGHLSSAGYALPLLEQYDMRAVFSLNAAQNLRSHAPGTQNFLYGRIGLEEILQLSASARVEIANQSDPPDAAFALSGEYGENGLENTANHKYLLQKTVLTAKTRLEDASASSISALAYPLGYTGEVFSDFPAEMGIDVVFSSQEGISLLEKGSCPVVLKRIPRPANISSAAFFADIAP